MLFFRALLFQLTFYVWTFVVSVGAFPAVLVRQSLAKKVEAFWARGVLGILKITVGLGFEVRGREHLPSGPAIFASKHQSAWDTIVFTVALDNPVYVLKKELLRIPVFGWYLRKLDMIAVDRAAGASALKGLVRDARRILGAGRERIVIFPEGIRVLPGAHIPYQPGVVGLYAMLEIPVVPVALNSGLFWRRRKILILPGVITLEFLPPIQPGLKRQAFLEELEARIESGSDNLISEAKARFPIVESNTRAASRP